MTIISAAIAAIKYLFKLLLFGDAWAIELVAYGVVLLFAYRNWYISGARFLRHYYEGGHFIVLSALAGAIHMVDLIWMVVVDDFVVLATADNALIEALAIIVFGLVTPAMIIYYTSLAIQKVKREAIDNRNMYFKIRRLSYRQ